jgi:uncharacterized SAM-binding protein YcdF (DUF218 family)
MIRPGRSRRGRRVLVNLAVGAVAAVALWTWGLFQFAAAIPTVVEDTSTPTDAVVVLTGGSQRLGEGLELLARGLGKKLFVSGVYRGVDVRAILQMVKRNPTELADRIGIGNATNTTGNATETTTWMQRENFRSLRLVTGAYHMPRSLLEFRHAMPDVTLVAHPVFPEHVKQKRWWAWPGTASLVIGEYAKYLVAWSRLSAVRVIKGAPAHVDAKGKE